MMAVELGRCQHCGGVDIVHYGRTTTASHVFAVRTITARGGMVIREYTYQGHSPEGKRQIVKRSLNGSVLRDSAWVLPIGPTAVLQGLKKRRRPSST
jgi:hypothetical protein